MEKIALDLDGVIFDSENLYRVYTEIYDTDIMKCDNIVDNNQRIFQNRYSWDEKEFKYFYEKYSSEILKKANVMTGSDIVINKLKRKFDIIIVTSRDNKETKIAKIKLKEIGLDKIKIFNNEYDKIDRLRAENVNYVIDDDAEVCINASKNGIKALYLKNNASNKILENNVINVNNWGEIYKYLILNKIAL